MKLRRSHWFGGQGEIAKNSLWLFFVLAALGSLALLAPKSAVADLSNGSPGLRHIRQ
jgi:hypothetical protein